MEIETITLQDVKDAAEKLDLVKGVTVEINPFNRHILVALYDRRDPKSPISGSWLGDGAESIYKLKNIQKRYGKVQNM